MHFAETGGQVVSRRKEEMGRSRKEGGVGSSKKKERYRRKEEGQGEVEEKEQ